MTNLLKKGVSFHWDIEQDKSFKKIKELLLEHPILRIYNPHAKTELCTDASSLGFGAVLAQQQSDQKFHPIAYYSRKTSKEASKYSAIELEALAIVSALERFRVYLIGNRFTIKTDCNSLRLLDSKRNVSPRIARWLMKLSEFDYEIEYYKGSQNVVAD